MLEELGLGEAATADDADVVVFNTCTIREKPDTKLAAYLGEAAARKRERPGPRDRRRRLLRRGAARADLRALPRRRRRVRARARSRTSATGSAPAASAWRAGGFGLDDRAFAATLPLHRERPFQAWVQVSMGCNSICSYCIVPAVRGREQSRRPGEIIAEVTRLAAEGVKEVTLLGQNVNSWGRDLAPDIRTEFGELLRACDAVDGHRADPLHEPAPEGLPRAGDRRDRRVRRGLRARPPAAAVRLVADPEGDAPHLHARALPRARRAACAPRFRTSRSAPTSSSASRARPSTTSSETLEVVEEVGFDSAFTFVYSPRQGTEAAAMARPGAARAEDRAHGAARRADAADRARAQRGARRPRRAGARRGAVAHRRERSSAAARAATRRSTSPATPPPGELVDVEIEGATSTTLRGTPGGARPAMHWASRCASSSPARPGQIGTNLALRLLRDGHSVFGVDKRVEHLDAASSTTLLQDLAGHYAAVPRRHRRRRVPEVDLVVHLAAHAKVHQLVRQPHRALENAMMTFNVLEYCRAARAAARLLVDAGGLRRRPPLRRVRRGGRRLRLHGEPVLGVEDRARRRSSTPTRSATACATSSSASRTSTAASTTTCSGWSA